jgi:hypothetical protein
MPNVEKCNRIPTTAVPDGRAKPDQLGRAEGARRQGHTRHRRPGHTVKKWRCMLWPTSVVLDLFTSYGFTRGLPGGERS